MSLLQIAFMKVWCAFVILSILAFKCICIENTNGKIATLINGKEGCANGLYLSPPFQTNSCENSTLLIEDTASNGWSRVYSNERMEYDAVTGWLYFGSSAYIHRYNGESLQSVPVPEGTYAWFLAPEIGSLFTLTTVRFSNPQNKICKLPMSGSLDCTELLNQNQLQSNAMIASASYDKLSNYIFLADKNGILYRTTVQSSAVHQIQNITEYYSLQGITCYHYDYTSSEDVSTALVTSIWAFNDSLIFSSVCANNYSSLLYLSNFGDINEIESITTPNSDSDFTIINAQRPSYYYDNFLLYSNMRTKNVLYYNYENNIIQKVSDVKIGAFEYFSFFIFPNSDTTIKQLAKDKKECSLVGLVDNLDENSCTCSEFHYGEFCEIYCNVDNMCGSSGGYCDDNGSCVCIIGYEKDSRGYCKKIGPPPSFPC